jgi:hypothetical protein
MTLGDSLPWTTHDDLRRLEITPEAIREQLERGGERMEGDTVSVSVLTDVALLNFDLSRLVIFSPKITGKETRESAVP